MVSHFLRPYKKSSFPFTARITFWLRIKEIIIFVFLYFTHEVGLFEQEKIHSQWHSMLRRLRCNLIFDYNVSIGQLPIRAHLSTPFRVLFSHVMLHSILVPMWPVMKSQWWHNGGISLRCLECQNCLTCYVTHDVTCPLEGVKP